MEETAENRIILHETSDMDLDWRVRLVAVETLAKFVPPGAGGERDLETLRARLGDEQWRVKHASLVALAKVAAPGDAATIRDVCEHLRETNYTNYKLELAAIDTLTKIVV